jgi:ribosome recycling factor
MDELVQKCDGEMAKAIESLKFYFKTIRSGVVSPSILDKIQAEYYGEKMPIKALASITAPTATQIVVKPFDPESIRPIVSAIGGSDLGVNPVVNGMSIYLSFPPLSGDRRKDFVKEAKGYADQAKVSIRNIRSDFVKKVENDKGQSYSEDYAFKLKDDLQKTTDKYNKLVDTLFAEKEKELLTL